MTQRRLPPPPKGFTLRHWNNVKAKRARELKEAIRAVYRLDPVLWAVIKGYDNEMAIMIKLNRDPEPTLKAINRSIKRGHIHRWGARFVPTKEEHKALRRRFARPV
jgi:hypothetical protein